MRKIRYKELSSEMRRISEPDLKNSGRPSLGMEQFIGEYFFIDIQRLLPYRGQARQIFNEEEIQKLAETIIEHGIRQPLTILKSSDQESKFEVVSGERRLRAAKLAGLQKVPCIILEDEGQAAEIALIENIQRQDLHPIELARSVRNLILKHPERSKAEIARKIGLSRSQLSENLKILELEEDILEKMLKYNIRGREHFRKALSLSNQEQRINYLEKISGINNKLSRKAIRSVLRISLEEEKIKVQKSQLKNLSKQQLEEIINILEQIMKELKE